MPPFSFNVELFQWCFHSAHNVLSPTNQKERATTIIFQLVFPLQAYWADTSEHSLPNIESLIALLSVCEVCPARKKNKSDYAIENIINQSQMVNSAFFPQLRLIFPLFFQCLRVSIVKMLGKTKKLFW